MNWTLVNRHRAAAALLLGLVALAYLPAIKAGWIWDDEQYVTGNTLLRTAEGLRRIWFETSATPQYYPLVHTTFWIEYQLWGLSPAGYHIVNILLHGLAAILLWLLLLELAVPWAWFAAAIFVLHPVHVESVAWVTERKNVLSAVCYLASALVFLRFAGPGDDAGASAGNRRGYRTPALWIIALLLFLAALLSKTVTATLPFALPILLWWRRGRAPWFEIFTLLPFAVCGAALASVTAWIERYQVGAIGPDWHNLLPSDRVLIAGRAVFFYLGKIFWPAGLAFIYPRWHIDSAVWWQYLFPLGVVVVLAALWLSRRRLGRGPVAAALFFLLTLGPALGFVDFYPMKFSFAADHFQYLASLGPICAAAAALTITVRRFPVTRWVPGLVLAALGSLTYVQAGTYLDAETLWRATLERNNEAWLAHNHLGALLLNRGNLEEAEGHLRKTIELRPDEQTAHVSLAEILSRKGRLAEAASRYEVALRLNPWDTETRANYGITLAMLRRYPAAEREFERVLKDRPNDPGAHYNLGNFLLITGRRAEAVVRLNRALQLDPGLGDARAALDDALRSGVPSSSYGLGDSSPP